MASISGANKIVLKGKYTEGGVELEEGPISGAGYPGMNVVMTAHDEANSFMRHTWKAGGTDYVGTGTNVTTSKAPVRVLKEDAYQGSTVDTAYADGNNCFVHIASPGDVLQVLVASGQTIVKGDGGTAGTDGKWVKDTTNAAVEFLEDTNGALGADTLVRARVL